MRCHLTLTLPTSYHVYGTQIHGLTLIKKKKKEEKKASEETQTVRSGHKRKGARMHGCRVQNFLCGLSRDPRNEDPVQMHPAHAPMDLQLSIKHLC